MPRPRKPHPKGLLRPWPPLRDRDVEALKWQVLIGFRLATWRRETTTSDALPGAAPELKQAVAERRAMLRGGRLSKIERGIRRVDAVELRRLLVVYGRSEDDLVALFRAPTDAEWREIQSARVAHKDFMARPTKDAGIRPF